MGSMSTFLRSPFSKDGLKCTNFYEGNDEIHSPFKGPSLLTTTTNYNSIRHLSTAGGTY